MKAPGSSWQQHAWVYLCLCFRTLSYMKHPGIELCELYMCTLVLDAGQYLWTSG